MKSLIASHLTLLEEQLSDGREWLFDTEQPGLGDLSVHYIYSWIMLFKSLKDLWSTENFPKGIAWIKRVTAFLNNKKDEMKSFNAKIKGDVAAKIVGDSKDMDDLPEFDKVEAGRLGLQPGLWVTVAPTDNAKTFTTAGKLLSITREEVIIETSGSAAPSVRCHFPRLNFTIRTSDATSKL